MTEGGQSAYLFFSSHSSLKVFLKTLLFQQNCVQQNKKHTAFLILVTRKSLSEHCKLHNHNNFLSVSH